ncbi:diguanylate cyclase [Vibrio agarivorans]|uniref:diguanylate cyclase n=1 Tax=Vibrio agarivorans TaxID=153622 RepID=UPI0025B436A2|nr:diguanylate cyclase [Vibrio agarivorans]MDN3661358.1 diguanylate cyclase [Vibrio agarivorans]
MGVLEHDIQAEIHKLKHQLEEARLSQRESSFKTTRELTVLRRAIITLTEACHTDSDSLRRALGELRYAMEQKQDISKLVPQLAVIERQLRQQITDTNKREEHASSEFIRCGETLLRVPGLPMKLKRDLRELLGQVASPFSIKLELAGSLLELYQRSIKILTSNPDVAIQDLENAADRELLMRLSSELQHLITELDFEGESGELLFDIRAKLLIGVSTESLLELTLQVLKLVIDGTHFERKSSEQFLEQVNTTLASSLKSSTQSIETQHSYLEQRKEMNRELDLLASKSQHCIENAGSFEQLKGNMTSMVSQLNSLSERLKLAEQREQSLIEQMNYSKGQVQSLFEQTQDHRRRLDDQSKRLLLDPLTKVYNRSAYNDHLELEYRRWVRSQEPLRVALLDIDGFKALNDSFGYTAGDKALKIIARTISTELADTDILGRFGGEEFALLLPNRSDNDCHELIKRIQAAISKLPFKFKDQQISITVSVSSTAFKDSDSPEEVMERLLRHLAEAKRLGPQQVVWK